MAHNAADAFETSDVKWSCTTPTKQKYICTRASLPVFGVFVGIMRKQSGISAMKVVKLTSLDQKAE